jgi:hypothetical protein
MMSIVRLDEFKNKDDCDTQRLARSVMMIGYSALRCVSSLKSAPHEVADHLEDAANRYLDLADAVRASHPISYRSENK